VLNISITRMMQVLQWSHAHYNLR